MFVLIYKKLPNNKTRHSLCYVVYFRLFWNKRDQICYERSVTLLTKRCWRVPPSLTMSVLSAGKTSSWSTGEERSCRNAVWVRDWASLSLWPISGSENSATSTAQRLSVTPPDATWGWWLSVLCGCSAHTAGPLTRTPEGDIVVLLGLAPCGRVCPD